MVEIKNVKVIVISKGITILVQEGFDKPSKGTIPSRIYPPKLKSAIEIATRIPIYLETKGLVLRGGKVESKGEELPGWGIYTSREDMVMTVIKDDDKIVIKDVYKFEEGK